MRTMPTKPPVIVNASAPRPRTPQKPEQHLMEVPNIVTAKKPSRRPWVRSRGGGEGEPTGETTA